MVHLLCCVALLLPQEFWKYWSDGKAEINRYIVTQQRYGKNRLAEVFTIYVTEPFDTQKQVKVDNPTDSNSKIAPVLKFNKSKKFQTGVYPYSTMTSVFTPITPYTTDNAEFPAGTMLKTTFSAQEWCGMTFHQLNRRKNGVESTSFSYFEAESDNKTLMPLQAPTLFADELFTLVRELIRPFTEASFSLFNTLEYRRLFHTPFASQLATMLKRDSTMRWKNQEIPVTYWRISDNHQTWEFLVEKQYPRKILEYRHTHDGKLIESARLHHSERLPYWKLNLPEHETRLLPFTK